MSARFFASRLPAVLALAVLSAGCFSVDNPPATTIAGLVDGVLSDASAPIGLQFSEPVVPSSLRARLVRYEVDLEGNLYDEDADPDTELSVLFDSGDPATGTGELDQARTTYTIDVASSLPIGPQLALVLDPGLMDDKGNVWKARQVIKFGYVFNCGKGVATAFPSVSKFFWIISVESPVPAQIRLLSELHVDPATGALVGQMTNAQRNKELDCTKFGLTCSAAEVCRTLPTPACVPPSEKAGSVDEFPDFIADASSAVGFSFTVQGCIADQPDGSFSFANVPADFVTKKPAVAVTGLALSTALVPDDADVLRGSGTLTAQQVGLGAPPNTIPSGKGAGTHAERRIPDDFAPPIPPPPSN
jgi:hypothetical protein